MGMVEKVQDPLLKRVVTQVEAQLKDPAMKKSYDQIVVAGMSLMYSDSTHPEMEQYLGLIKGPQDVPKYVAHGIVKVLSIVQNESKQPEPLRAVGPAGITLMAQALEFVEQRNKIPVDKAMVDETTMLIKEGILALYKITPEVLAQLQQRGQQGGPPPPGGPPAGATPGMPPGAPPPPPPSPPMPPQGA